VIRVLFQHLQILVATLGRLYRRPVSTALTVSGIGVALAVPLTLYVLVVNLSAVFERWGEAPRLTIYLEKSASEDVLANLARDLEQDPRIEHVEVIGRRRGLEQLLMQESLVGLDAYIDENPLPDVIEVFPSGTPDSAGYRNLAAELKMLDHVAEVQIDFVWVERLRAVTDLALKAIGVFWILLFAAVALVISNSVRLSLVTAKREIEVISLVGGSESFIRRPYLYQGTLQGIIGALVAVGIAASVFVVLSPTLERLLAAYLGVGEVRFARLSELARMVLVCAFFGWLASLVTIARFLRDVLPR
jgi:cell division transport system permease protein